MSAAEPPDNEDVTDRRSLGYLAVVRVLRSVAAGMINVAFPFLVLTELHFGTLLLGVIYSAATLASAFVGLGVGLAADRFGRRVSFTIALALLPASSVILVTGSSVPLLFLAAMLGGISATGALAGGGVGGAAQPVQSALVAELTSRRERTKYFSLLPFISGVAAAAGAFLGGFGEIRDVFAMAAVLGAASLLFSPLIRTRKTVRRTFSLKSGLAIGKFSVAGMLNGLSLGLVAPFLIPFFIVVYSVTRQEMNVYAAASGLVASFALLLGPRIERRLGFLRGMIASRAASILLALTLPLVRIFPVSLFVYLAFPATRVMAVPAQSSAMMDMVKSDERGAAFGINQTTRLVASSGGTYFSGVEFGAAETAPLALDIPFALYGVVAAVSLGVYWWFFRKYRPPRGVTEKG